MPAYSPSPASHSFGHAFYAPDGIYSQPDDHMSMNTPGAHQDPHGRMAIPHHGMPINVMNINPHATPSPQMDDEFGPSPFLPEDGQSPSVHHVELSPTMSPILMQQSLATAAQLGYGLQRPMSVPLSYENHNAHRPQQRPGRPVMIQRHTLTVPPRPAPLHRQASLQAPARSASPHFMAGDVFDPMPGSPVKRPSSSLGLVEHRHEMVYNLSQDFGVSPYISANLHFTERRSTIPQHKAFRLLEHWVQHPCIRTLSPLVTMTQ